MLDVLHFYLEEDLFDGLSDGRSAGKHAIRKHLYGEFYDTDYSGPGGETQEGYEPTRNADGLYVDEDLDGPVDKPVDPRLRKAPSEGTKPYIPPTEFDHDADDPFAEALSADAVRKMRSRR